MNTTDWEAGKTAEDGRLQWNAWPLVRRKRTRKWEAGTHPGREEDSQLLHSASWDTGAVHYAFSF